MIATYRYIQLRKIRPYICVGVSSLTKKVLYKCGVRSLNLISICIYIFGVYFHKIIFIINEILNGKKNMSMCREADHLKICFCLLNLRLILLI